MAPRTPKVSEATGPSRAIPPSVRGDKSDGLRQDPQPCGATLRLASRIRSWGELLDRLGWCVAVDLPDQRGGWLGMSAREWISRHAPDESVSDTISRDRMVMLRETIPGMQVRISAHGLLVWAPDEAVPGATDTAGEDLPQLSPREREILAWTREGKTSGEIAVILGRAPRTVEKHLENIYRKLGVCSRSSLILQRGRSSARGSADA